MSIGDKLAGIDFDNSYLLNVIYDDESLTLEMDYALSPDHPRYSAPEAGAEGCFRQGFLRFGDIVDLRLAKGKGRDGGETDDYSTINSARFEGDHVAISSGWGEIEVTARSVRVAVD